MAADLNRVTLVGRLTRDPELRHTGGGTAVCNLRLAVSSRAQDEQGEWGDKSNYFDVTVFGRQAESVTEYMGKGRRIGVDGRLSWREWSTQDGGKRQSVEVIAQDVFFLDSARDQQAPASGGNDIPTPPPTRGSSAGDMDIPFAWTV